MTPNRGRVKSCECLQSLDWARLSRRLPSGSESAVAMALTRCCAYPESQVQSRCESWRHGRSHSGVRATTSRLELCHSRGTQRG